MARRKITEEAEKKAGRSRETTESDTTSSETETESDSRNESDSGSDSSGRKQLTQRMPPDLVDDVDDWADAHGMSRNTAINFLVREALPDE